jgi:PIN domain nuclease of toxin-antitoxin system
VRILIDTQCWLWWFLSPERLGRGARDLIAAARDPLYLSAVSSWEIAIKVGLRKLELPEPPARYVPARLAAQGMNALPIEHAHALRVAELPAHHADPFDRLLVAQAQLERMVLMTADPQIPAYAVETLWAREGPAPRRRTKPGGVRPA